jgi:hypothetical protein
MLPDAPISESHHALFIDGRYAEQCSHRRYCPHVHVGLFGAEPESWLVLDFNSNDPVAVEMKARVPLACFSTSRMCALSISANAVESESANAAVSLMTDKAREGSAQRPVTGLKMWLHAPDLSN